MPSWHHSHPLRCSGEVEFGQNIRTVGGVAETEKQCNGTSVVNGFAELGSGSARAIPWKSFVTVVVLRVHRTKKP